MADEEATVQHVLDENARRYYLDTMGIQCWQSLPTEADAEADRDVISVQPIGAKVSWPQLESSIQSCQNCTLHQSRKQAIVGRGNKSAELMFVLLAPDIDDDRSGFICAGEYNDLLTKMLAAINVSIDDIYITSLLKCHSPPQHTISPTEIQHCNNHLKLQIQLLQPKQLIVMGEIAVQCLLKVNSPLDELRNRFNTVAQNSESNAGKYKFESIPLFVSYSPEELIEQPENKRKAWEDLQLLQKLI